MDERELCAYLRRSRGGTAAWADLPGPYQSLLGPSLAGACRTLATWAERRLDDRLAADAFVRYYGFVTLPEELDAIAGTTPSGRATRRPPWHASVDTVGRHRDAALAQLAVDLAEENNRRTSSRAGATPLLVFPTKVQVPTPATWDADPFDGPSGFDRAGYENVRLWAWADLAPGAVHEAAVALWQYEYHHGLRPAPHRRADRSRNQTRDRRRAHAIIAVAKERFAALGRTVPFDKLDRFAGPRQLVVPDPATAAALDGILAGLPERNGADRAQLGELISCASVAVHGDRPEAGALLALARDLAARCRPDLALQARLAALTAIDARIRRDLGGLLAAHSAMRLAEVELDALGVDLREPAKANVVVGSAAEPVVRQALRAAQEAVRIRNDLELPGATDELGRFRGLLAGGDPDEDFEPGGWMQQYLLTESSLVRSLSGTWQPDVALDQADRSAGASFDLVGAHELPRSWAIGAALQGVGVEVDRARFSDESRRGPHLRAARRRLDAVRALAPRIGDGTALSTTSLTVALQARWWQIALLDGHFDEVEAARVATFAACSPATLPTDLERVVELERASEDLGLEAQPVPVALEKALNRRRDRKAMLGG